MSLSFESIVLAALPASSAPVLTLGLAGWTIGVLGVLFVMVCLMLVLTVLIQRPQGGGLAGAFGSGAGSGQTAFGTKTGDALTIFTIVVFVAFVGMSIGLNFALRPAQPKDTQEDAQTDPNVVPPELPVTSTDQPTTSSPATGTPTTGAPTTGSPMTGTPAQGDPAPSTLPATGSAPIAPPTATPASTPAPTPAPVPGNPK